MLLKLQQWHKVQAKDLQHLLAVHYSYADRSRMFHLMRASMLIASCRVCSGEAAEMSVLQTFKDCVKDLLLLLLWCFL